MNRQSIERAAARLAPHVARTPLVESAWLSRVTGARVFMKLETAQITGSFKARGAMHALLALRERAPETTMVVAASAGNHGKAIAWAGREIGIRVRVHVPVTAPRSKRATIQAMGAELVEAATYDDAETAARDDAARTGLPYVSPYNDDDVMSGAGTIALEMLEEQPGIDAFVIAVGGGGLISGCGIVAKDRKEPIEVIGAELEHSPVFTAALAAGAITPVTVLPTLGDALAGNLEPNSRTFLLCQHLVDRLALVAEGSIEAAMRGLWQHEQIKTEGAGAVGTAALLQGLGLAGRTVGVIVCGGNVDEEVFARVTMPGGGVVSE
jgi:threonine dehydratase